MEIAAVDSPPLARATLVRALYPVRACLRDGSVITIRPIGPDDAEREQAFVHALSPESRYFRFMSALKELAPETLYRFTHPDFEREVALVALVDTPGAELQQIGVARCIVQGDNDEAEFAVVVADAWHGKGVGRRLMCELIRAARALGITRLWGDVLATNHRMLGLMHALGFAIMAAPEDALLRKVVKSLGDKAAQKDLTHAT
jgi:acetyltransferase